MFLPYKILKSDVSRMTSMVKNGEFINNLEEPKFEHELNQIGLFQILLNQLLPELHKSFQEFNKANIEKIFMKIDANFVYDPGLIDIFKFYNFPRILIELLRYEEWQKNYLTLTMLSYLIYCADDDVIDFLLQNNLIQIINIYIIANNDFTPLALLCLGNIIIETKNKYQKLICDQINFYTIVPQIYKEEEELIECESQLLLKNILTQSHENSLIALFFLYNLIYFFRILPDPPKLIYLLKKILLQSRNCEGVIFYLILCLIEMVKIDNTVLKIIFANEDAESDQNIFLILYAIYCFKEISLNLKKEIIVLFTVINRKLNFLSNKFPDQQNTFLQMKNIMLARTFSSYESLVKTEKLNCSNCISMCLSLLQASIRLYQKNYVSSNDKLKKTYHIIKSSIVFFQESGFELKNSSLRLLISMIEIFHDNLDILRYMREQHIYSLLVDSLSFDDKNILQNVLLSIHTLIDAFANSVESQNVKNEFSSQSIGDILNNLHNCFEDDAEFHRKIELVKYDVYGSVEDF